MEYFLFILLIAVLVFMHNSQPHRFTSYLLFVFVSSALVALVGLRGMEDEYTRLYARVLTLPEFFQGWDAVGVEKGYLFALICSVLKSLHFSSQALFFVFALASIGLHAYFFKKFTKYYFLALLFYLSHEIIFKDVIGIRMGLASSLVLPMIYFIRQRRVLPYYLVVLAASLIHYVSVISIVLKWLDREFKASMVMMALAIAYLLAYLDVFRVVVLFVDGLGVLPEFVSVYLGWETHNYDLGVLHPKLIQQVLLVLFCLFLRKQLNLEQLQYYPIIFNTYLVSTLAYVILSDLAIFSVRFAGHFNVVEPVLLTYTAYAFRQKQSYLGILALLALLVSFINYVSRDLLAPYNMLL